MRLCKKFVFAACALMLSQSALSAPQPLDQIAVQVNDGIVLDSEISNMIDSVRANAENNNQALPSDSALRTQVIERLILTRLQLANGKSCRFTYW